MKTKYVLHNWSAVSQMINEEDPRLKVSYVIDPQTKVESIVVEKFSSILVKVNVESGGVWSLSNDEVIKMLNSYGFDCVFIEEDLKISEDVKVVLTSLSSLGYLSITRRVSPKGEIRAFKEPNDAIGTKVNIKDYRDWRFLRINTLTSIDKILEDINS